LPYLCKLKGLASPRLILSESSSGSGTAPFGIEIAIVRYERSSAMLVASRCCDRISFWASKGDVYVDIDASGCPVSDPSEKGMMVVLRRDPECEKYFTRRPDAYTEHG
jgi:hypothetical protein